MINPRKYTLGHGSRINRRLLIGAAAVLILGVSTGILIAHGRSRPAEPIRKVVYDAEENQSVEDQLIAIPRDAKSAVCDTISLPKLEDILGQKTNGARVSIPNTSNAEGSVSGCAYIVNGEQAQEIRSVIISTRVFKDSQAAKKAYEVLTKLPSKNRIQLGSDAFYSPTSNQLVELKDAQLHNVTLSLGTSRPLDKAVYQKFQTLF